MTLEAPIRAAPVVYDGRVVAVPRDDRPMRSTPAPAATLWRTQGVGGTGLLGGASPAADGQLVVLPFASGEVLGVLGRNGLTVWGTAVTGGRREPGAQPHQRHQRRPGHRRRLGLCLEPERAHRPARPPLRRAGLDHAGGLLRAGLAGRRIGLPALRPSARWCGPTPRPAASSGRCSCRSCSPTRGSSGAASRSGRCPTTGRCWPAAGSGWRAATGCCAASARRTARCSAEVPIPGGASAAPAVAGGVHLRRQPRRAASRFPIAAASG